MAQPWNGHAASTDRPENEGDLGLRNGRLLVNDGKRVLDFPKQYSSDVIPTTGAHEDPTGTIVWNAAPTSGEPVGWVHTPTGWKGFGVILP